MAYELALSFGIILALVHFFSDKIEQLFEQKKIDFISFSAGISTAYLFLVLLPDLYTGYQLLNSFIFLLVLLGFTVFHLTEKWVYQNTSALGDLRHKLKEVHGVTWFVYHGVLGILLAELTQSNPIMGMLFFVPILFHTGISTFSLEQLHDKLKYHLPARALLSVSTLAGILLASQLAIPSLVTWILYALIGGALFFIVIREYIPPERQGNPRMYFIATMGFAILVFVLNNLKLI
ncbi:MAG: hypothetical protein Q7S92_06900 [Candidatus Diapherotrites archaeon]|nr:hypothetical protein [Candidatus Diapherotrites archaeon]